MISSQSFPGSPRDALRVLNAVSGFTNRKIIRLLRHFGDPLAVFAADPVELERVAGVARAPVLNLLHFCSDEFLRRDNAALSANGASVLTWLDDDYPALLKEIPDAPVVLYFRGNWPPASMPALAIVGSRHCSVYGRENAYSMAADLAERGAVIVSGMAQGVDAAAHRGALAAGGRTIGVLGCGLDIVYPEANRDLFREMERKACLVSEFPFGSRPTRFSFPRRNRIVSGLSLGTLVVEAGLRSGALITAAFALEQGREVFALPGRVGERQAEGPLSLIRQGAKLLVSIDDVLEEIPALNKKVAPSSGPVLPLDELEQGVLEFIKTSGRSLEDLELLTGLPSFLLMRPLLALQIRGLINELPGSFYSLSSGVSAG